MNYPETAEEFLGSADIVNIWKMKYALPDEVHPRDTYKRVAHELYLQLLEDHDNTPILKELGIISEEQLYQLFIDRIIVPQGRPMLGLGNPDYVSVSNCVVTGAPKDSYEDIIATRYRMVELYKRGMGCGFHINNLRPKGLKVTNSSKFATGPASFVNGFSNTTLEVAQLGRRGALMVMINARHPDAEEFIRLKAEDENYCSGANLSVQIEDDFWNAAKNNQQYIQKWPIDVELTGPEVEYIDSRPLGELVLLREGKAAARRIEAKKLWDLIIYCAWKKAEPGIILWTRQHKYSTSSVYPKYINSSTNPCSEIAMQEYDTCRLFAVNLSKFVCNPFEDSAKIDFDYLYKMCAINQVLCDALVSVEIKRLTRIKEKIQSDQGLTQNEINLSCELYDNLIKSAHEGRRTGCGYLGLVDMYTELGWIYGDTRIEQVFKTKCKAEFDASILLARYHKPFDGFDRSVEEKSDFIKMMKADPYFEDTLKNMFKYGRRNVSLSTVAPTGTVSLIAGCNGGIEPYFRLRYKRRVKLNEEQPGCYRDSEGILWIDTWREEPMYKLFKEKYAGKPNVNSSFIYEVFEANTSDKISLDDRIRVQSLSQKYITHSISSTVNLPNQATVEDVELIYRKAHDAGLKGVTVYRDGCRTGVLISEETDNKRKLNIATKFKRPKSLEAEVIRYKNQGEKWVAIISLFEGKPIEIFTESEENMGFVGLTVDKGQVIRTKGKDINRYDFVYTLGEPGEEKLTIPNITSNLGEYSNYARLLSGLLKYGVPVEQVYFTIDGLKFENEDITSWKTGIKRVLKKYIKDGVEYKGEVCPNCGGKMIFKDGCAMCESCGWSKCG